jgi:hypothetical protein
MGNAHPIATSTAALCNDHLTSDSIMWSAEPQLREDLSVCSP